MNPSDLPESRGPEAKFSLPGVPGMAPQSLGEVSGVASSQHTALTSSLEVKAGYRCGYCHRVVLSVSGAACGRAPRIRCVCGGIQQDGERRLHSKWTLVRVQWDTRSDQARKYSGFRKVTNNPAVVLHAQAAAGRAVNSVNFFPALDGAAQHVSNECANEAGNSVDDSLQQQPTKRPRTDSCIGTGCESSEMLDELKRYFAIPLVQIALDEWTEELDLQENSSASGFSTGNAVGRSIEDTQLWSADDEKTVLIRPIGQQAAAGSVSSLWQRLSLAVFAVLGFIKFDNANQKTITDTHVQDATHGLLSPLWQHLLLILLSVIFFSTVVEHAISLGASSNEWLTAWSQVVDYMVLLCYRYISGKHHGLESYY